MQHLSFSAATGALINATIWGVFWFPLKWLNTRGLPPLWTTWFTFIACTLVICVVRPRALGLLWKSKVLWWVLLASGMTNACFNMALAAGDVVRAVLLFYLMPMWVVFLARWLINERITTLALARVLLALIGAALVLGNGHLILPLPQTGADWLAVVSGFFFGLNNVLLRKYSMEPENARMLAMFAGAVIIVPLIMLPLSLNGLLSGFVPEPTAWLGLALLAVLVLIANLALQYAAVRLPANVLSVIMLTEILVATLSSWLANEAVIGRNTLIGGALIISASLFAILIKPAPIVQRLIAE